MDGEFHAIAPRENCADLWRGLTSAQQERVGSTMLGTMMVLRSFELQTADVATTDALMSAQTALWVQALLAKRKVLTEPIFSISANYTGVTLETLNDPEAGDWQLCAGGQITESGAHGPPVRIAYLSVAAAPAMHAKATLVPVGESSVSTMSGSFRFARPGEMVLIKAGALISAFSQVSRQAGVLSS